MIRAVALVLSLGLSLLPGLASAEALPALHSVTGVAAGDVLSIRRLPDPEAEVIGTLPPDATGVEVIEVVDSWALINTGDFSGYALLRFLAREDGPAWNALSVPLTCLGTEPFWSLGIDPAAGDAGYTTPENPEPQVSKITDSWPGQIWAPAAAVALPGGLAVMYPAACSDGMSERSYGIAIDFFLNAVDAGTGQRRLSGCCLIASD
jgi:uncharacterized membrane protein